MRLETETLAGRYILERELGRGGMGTVYYATDTILHRPVALKLLADHLIEDAALRKRLLHEARIAARLSHPAIVQVYDAGEEQGRPYIVMEYVDGETLRAVLDRRGRLPADEVVDLAAQISGGLAFAHSAGLVHRDIKPHNLLVTAPQGVKIVDFGIAFADDTTSVTDHGTILGSAGYLAPEQAAGQQVTAAADVYSFGVVLYELLSGEKPDGARSLPELLAQQHSEAITPLHERAPEVPISLEQTVRRCLATDPRVRPSSADLARHLGDRTPDPPTERLEGVRVPVTTPLPARHSRRISSFRMNLGRRRLLGLAACLTALAAVAAALALSGAENPPSDARDVPRIDRSDAPAQQARNLATWLRDQADSAAATSR